MKLLPLKPFYNVAANGQAQLLTQELGTQYSLHALHFVLGGGNNNANTSQIWVRFAKQDIINLVTNAGSALAAGTMMQAINSWKATGAGTAGYLSLFFGDPELYHQLGAGVAPTLTAWAEVEPPKALRGFSDRDAMLHKVFLRSTPPV